LNHCDPGIACTLAGETGEGPGCPCSAAVEFDTLIAARQQAMTARGLVMRASLIGRLLRHHVGFDGWQEAEAHAPQLPEGLLTAWVRLRRFHRSPLTRLSKPSRFGLNAPLAPATSGLARWLERRELAHRI
jgi:hypothetical protein